MTDLARTANAIRRLVVQMIAKDGKGYLQQGLGAADIFTVLFFHELRLDPANPTWPERDRFLLSTAHNSALFHATLAARGLLDPEQLETYTCDGSPLEINVSERLAPLVEATCGSLGQCLSVAVGMAESAKRRQLSFRTYVVLGDGELQEGQTWEAAMYAGAHQLRNLCLVIDRNDMQVEGRTTQVLAMEPLADKWRAFGWHVSEVDGHDVDALVQAFADTRTTANRPSVIIAQTLVGKGVPFLEGQPSHNIVLPAESARKALAALGDPVD
jgi:transketolase